MYMTQTKIPFHFSDKRSDSLLLSTSDTFCSKFNAKKSHKYSKMSFFGKMFGTGKKGEAAPTTGEAIQKLRETEEMLIKKQDFLEKKIEQVRIYQLNFETIKVNILRLSFVFGVVQ